MNRKQELDELVAAFVRLVHQAHANPDRVGCPDRATLVSLATQPASRDFAHVLDHLSQCAPCLEELAKLRRLKPHPSNDSDTG